MDRFADDIRGLRETEFERRSRADWSLRIVRSQRDAMCVSQGGDATGFAETAAVGQVQLADLAAALCEQIAKGGQVGQAFTGGDGRGYCRIDSGQAARCSRANRALPKSTDHRVRVLWRIAFPSQARGAHGNRP